MSPQTVAEKVETPTRVLAEGGYETRGIYTGGVGLFDPRVEAVLVDKVRELSKQVGR